MGLELMDDLLAPQHVARRYTAEHVARHVRRWDREADILRDMFAAILDRIRGLRVAPPLVQHG